MYNYSLPQRERSLRSCDSDTCVSLLHTLCGYDETLHDTLRQNILMTTSELSDIN